MTPENKVKEYIERARYECFQQWGENFDSYEVLLVAQMLQREEHFNSKSE